MYGELNRGGHQSKGEPRVITDRAGLVESIGEGFEVGGKGSSENGVVRNGERD